MGAGAVATMVAGTRRPQTASGVAMLKATAAVGAVAGAVALTLMWMTSQLSPHWVRVTRRPCPDGQQDASHAQRPSLS